MYNIRMLMRAVLILVSVVAVGCADSTQRSLNDQNQMEEARKETEDAQPREEAPDSLGESEETETETSVRAQQLPAAKQVSDGNLLAATDDFSKKAWEKKGEVRIEPGAAVGPEPGTKADRIYLGPNTAILQAVPKNVEAGTTFAAGIWLWGEEDTAVDIFISRHGGTDYEDASISASVTKKPTYFEVTHTFQKDHNAIRFWFRNRSDEGISFFAWNPEMVQRN